MDDNDNAAVIVLGLVLPCVIRFLLWCFKDDLLRDRAWNKMHRSFSSVLEWIKQNPSKHHYHPDFQKLLEQLLVANMEYVLHGGRIDVMYHKIAGSLVYDLVDPEGFYLRNKELIDTFTGKPPNLPT